MIIKKCDFNDITDIKEVDEYMINNFENLTPEERGFLRDNYEFLTSEQRDKYDKEMINKIDETKLSEAQKSDLKNAFTDDFHKSISDIITVLQKRYGENYRDKIKDISQAEIGLIIDELKISDSLKDKSVSSLIISAISCQVKRFC